MSIDPRAFTLADVEALPRFGGLTTGEDRVIGEALTDAPDVAKALAELCDLIGTAEGLSLLEARKVVVGPAEGDQAEPKALELADKYRAEIKTYSKLSRQYGYSLMDATVTAFMDARSGLDGWEMRHTKGMMRDVFLAVWNRAQEEIKAENQPVVEPTEESMGKPLAVKPASKRTGRRSTGN
jgi:hypothetical protein